MPCTLLEPHNVSMLLSDSCYNVTFGPLKLPSYCKRMVTNRLTGQNACLSAKASPWLIIVYVRCVARHRMYEVFIPKTDATVGQCCSRVFSNVASGEGGWC